MAKRYRDDKGTRTGTLLESGCITAVSAGSAGAIAAVVTTPVDVVKTRIMLSAAEGAAENQSPRTRSSKQAADGVVDAVGKKVQAGKEGIKSAVSNVAKPASRKGSLAIAKEIMADSGVKGLFRGGALRAVWTMIGSGLYLGVYESGRIYLARRRGEDVSEEDLQ